MKLIFRKSDNHVEYHENVREVINQIIKEDKLATPYLHLVYIGLYSFNYVGQNNCFPSYDAIAERIGMSKSTVSRCIVLLEKYHIILIKAEYNSALRKTTKKYYFPLEFNLSTKEGIEEFSKIVGENDAWRNYYEEVIEPLIEEKEVVEIEESGGIF